MAVITITSDLGLKDFYVPAVKGYLLRHAPAANIVDITHQIEPFNLSEASFVVRGCYRDFPPGTIHIISVDSDYNDNKFIIVKTPFCFFIAPDNGIISLIIDGEEVEKIIEIPFNAEDLIFPLKNIMAPAASRMINGEGIENIGIEIKEFRQKANQRPLLEENIIRGNVVYVDNLGNAITNITSSHLNRYGLNRKFLVYIGRKEYFETISTHYNEVPEGEKVCFFSSTGALEIAINKGNASNLLGLKLGHTVLVEFL